MHRYVLALLIVASPFSALAGELPKEGRIDITSCWSGVATNVITLSKTTAQLVGEIRALTAAILPEALVITTLINA